MAVGFVMVDLLTPGKLRDLIWRDKNPNAALLLAANQLGIAVIVFTAIFTSYDSFGQGLASTLIFGIIGIAIMGFGVHRSGLDDAGQAGRGHLHAGAAPGRHGQRRRPLRRGPDRRRLHRLRFHSVRVRPNVLIAVEPPAWRTRGRSSTSARPTMISRIAAS